MLHARDPGLAASEGVFALSNPGHLLAGVGIALVAVGLAGALATLALDARGIRPRSARARLGVAAAALALALVAGGTGVWAAAHGGDPAAAHVHDGATAAAAGTTGGADGAGMAEHPHGRNLPDVAAATADERARAEASGRPRRPAPSAGATRRRRRPPDSGSGTIRQAPSGASGSSTCPTRRGAPTGGARPGTSRDARLLTGPGDRLTLVGVMYTAARGASGPAVGGPITRWHDHESCRDPATRASWAGPPTAPVPTARSSAAAAR